MRTLQESTQTEANAWAGLKVLAIAGTLAAGLVLSACHTVEGAGRDVQSIGGGVEDTADDVRPYE